MKLVLSAVAATILLLVPAAWTTANAHEAGDHSGMPAMSMTKAETFGWGHPGKASDVDRVIHIKAEDSMRFVPDKLTIKSGSTVKFVITNTGKLEHEFVLGPVSEQTEHEQEMQAMMHSMMGSDKVHMEHSDPNEVELAPGATRTLIWTFAGPGALQYGCHEPGHYAAGMFGTITVVGAD